MKEISWEIPDYNIADTGLGPHDWLDQWGFVICTRCGFIYYDEDIKVVDNA